MQYNIFISHSWTYSNVYDRLVDLLRAYPGFTFKNYSVPKDDPIHNASNDYMLKLAIRNQMQYASCVLILAGVYSTYSKWINIEIRLAKELNKRVIAVRHWGAIRCSQVVQDNADQIVNWNTNSIVNAIKNI